MSGIAETWCVIRPEAKSLFSYEHVKPDKLFASYRIHVVYEWKEMTLS